MSSNGTPLRRRWLAKVWRSPCVVSLLASPAGDPDAQAFRMPAEWEEHEATWLGWPHNLSDWPGRFAPIPWVYGEIVRKLSEGERVRILVRSAVER